MNPNEESKSVSESDGVPQTKKIKLSESCETLIDWQRDIMKREMLSDIPVNTAQTLLKKQFPNFNGLQPTIHQQRNQPVEIVVDTNQLQIIHSHSNHWVAVSSVGCKNDSVYVYDSLYTSLDEMKVVSRQFHARCITMQPMQKLVHVGGADCGLFAVAVITAICHGKDPSQMHFKQEEMRDLLLKCFKDKCMTLFPCIELLK